VNDNLADYLVPVNADIQQLEVILMPEEDDKVNHAGVKGIGELGNVGTVAAVANAVYHAGRRVYDVCEIRPPAKAPTIRGTRARRRVRRGAHSLAHARDPRVFTVAGGTSRICATSSTDF
jgi:hypothetical protein